MPSGFAGDIVNGLGSLPATWAMSIDVRLAEVRAVLYVTRRRTLPDGPCWCKSYLPTLGHTEDCQRARALYSQLEIK